MTVIVTIAGVSSPVIPFESLDISETLAMPGPTPSTAHFEIVDKANTITVADLADVSIADGGETLFRGQVVSTDERPIGPYKRIMVDCQDYNRLTPTMPVGQPVGTGTSAANDGSGASIPWDTQASTGWASPSGGPDSLAFAHFVGHYWQGPSTTFDYVDYTTSFNGDTYWSDTTLDVVLGDLCAMVGSGQVYWLDADMKWHFTSYPAGPSVSWTVTGNDGRLARRLPMSPIQTVYTAPRTFSDTPDYSTSFPTHELHRKRDGTQIIGRVYVRGATTAGSGWETSPWGTVPANAPAAVITAPSRNASERAMYGQAELARRAASASTYTFYSLGGSGWHRGQYVKVTNGVLGLSGAYLVVRSLKLTMASADSTRRYDFELGDQQSVTMTQSIRGTRGGEWTPPTPTNAKDPAVRFVVLPLWDTAPDAGTSQIIAAQLTTASGDPVRAANIVANWTLYKNSVAIGQGSSGDGASLLYPQTLTDVTGRAANSWQMYSPAASDYFEVIVSSATRR